MPRENRKRGKKHKKSAVGIEAPAQPHEYVAEVPESHNERPSWIVPAPNHEEVNAEAPFGYVDADVKAYFRNVDNQMRSWQERHSYDAGDGLDTTDPNEERRIFFLAALSEMMDKEKMLATDPDCSLIIERMAYSMDDFVRRVFMDKLSGSYEVLVKHRFSSHVCQTLLSVVADTVSREYQGIYPALPEGAEEGELRTITRLILDICEELLPSFSSLVMDDFASHVVRALLLLLYPNAIPSQLHSNLRSRKSTAWKAKQGPLKSVFSDTDMNSNSSGTKQKNVPKEFLAVARRFVEALSVELSDNEVRALAANKVASPVLQMLLEIEASEGMSNQPGSLMDRILVGIISTCQVGPPETHEPSDYLNTLLRDPTSSHLLETLVTRSPDLAFGVLWTYYFQGKLTRLCIHPVANFVVAKSFERLDERQLREVCLELSGSWARIIQASRPGVLLSLINCAVSLKGLGTEVEEAMFTAFGFTTLEQKRALVSCVICLLPISDYEETLKRTSAEKHADNNKKYPNKNDPLEPKVQGALLLQSSLRLPEPHCRLVLDSLASLSMEDSIRLGHHPAGSRVFDALLESPSVPFKDKRRFVMSFIGHYHLLVDDRVGSRVGDRCWAFADTYLKEKIARSLIPHETQLSGSYYGKFFARNLNLYLLQRKPDEWRNLQSQRGRETQAQRNEPQVVAVPPTPVSHDQSNEVAEAEPGERRKGKRSRQVDEIDALFNARLGKKIKNGALGDKVESSEHAKELSSDPSLAGVLGAIRSAPKDDKKRRKKHK
ncbi:hypothetical protein PLEOSDRAFT_1092908 [Pleurotus ostreatus PC15]|uniref:Nucleolar protein 9 n=1 Tax=Pleurotus ostreatus (strain PC15) TaxID=1137138 RepID=A0A067NMZ5_PLEO1|nr:hypothetical protein PLEOSDRAFT_1092908 [Pleurotus ostreatus PC15]